MSFRTYSDGGARGNPGPAAIGVVLCDDKDQVIEETSRSIGETTNNVAEYNAMLLALELAQKHNVQEVVCYADSELIIFQLTGVYRIKDSRMKVLSDKVREAVKNFKRVEFRQVPREHPMISRADKLLNQTLNRSKYS